jgi:AraC-like DNA-binding protein
MTANCDPVRERFEVPGFVSDNRPEFEKVRSVTNRSERPLFFARYRHDKPNLGLLEQTPLADQVIVSVELRPFRPINVFCDGHHKRKPASGAGALALYDMRRSWCADIRDPFDTLQVFLPINSFRDFAAERRSSFLDFRYDLQESRYDAVMLHLMQAMLPALERPQEVSALYLGSMFLAVRDHIAEAYGDFTKKAVSNRLGLTARQLRHALEYIEANLSQDVSLTDVANASATSVSSLSRGFKTSLRECYTTQRGCGFLRVRRSEPSDSRLHAEYWQLPGCLAAERPTLNRCEAEWNKKPHRGHLWTTSDE